jgi:large subunit ribosomal protein L5
MQTGGTGMARLHEQYFQTILPALKAELQVDNIHAVPRLTKVVINMGVGSATQDRKRLDEAAASLATIAGQKPVITKAKKAISSFRLREGMDIGCKVTLRGKRMYEFLDRLITLALPRVRDFRGLSPKAFDGNGNYSLGLSEQMVFPEIDADRISHPQGMHVTLVTTATSDNDARVLLRHLGIPFSDKNQKPA